MVVWSISPGMSPTRYDALLIILQGERRLNWIVHVLLQDEMWQIGKQIGDKEGRLDACVAAAGILKNHTDCLTYPAAQFRQVRVSVYATTKRQT